MSSSTFPTAVLLSSGHVTGFFLLYVALLLGSALGLAYRAIKRRGGRAPVAFKLLRGPGETLRRRLTKSDEVMCGKLAVAVLAPMGILLSALWVLTKFQPLSEVAFRFGLGLAAALFLITCGIVIRWLHQEIDRYRCDWLGYMGEREVAEHLMPLLASGYQVFHDVPAREKSAEFNLDHVAVGSSGVAVIEVKTRRKGRARPGFKDHVVSFDGRQLIWPWGEDRRDLEQAANEAEWLRKFIVMRTGIDTKVKPILALPGWWVEAKARGAVAVVNSKSVAAAVRGNEAPTLGEKEIALIARQLESLCRDVED